MFDLILESKKNKVFRFFNFLLLISFAWGVLINIIAEIYKNRICKRYPKHTSEDFIFYPNENNRERVRRLIYDVFIRTSKKLNLFVCSRTNLNRPLYSLRSYGFIELRNSGVDLQDIASLGNTSSKMLEERYLSEYNPIKMTDLYDRIFNKKK